VSAAAAPLNAANLLTTAGAGAGLLAIFATVGGALPVALTSLVAAVLLDRLDGVVARRMGIESELGKQLDSLADATSFLLAPAAIVAVLSEGAIAPCLLAAAFALAGIWRLARFNVTGLDETGAFQGVPTTLAGAWFTVAWAALRVSPLEPHSGLLLGVLLGFLAPTLLAPVTVRKDGLLVKPLYLALLPTLVAIWW
jgi:CDP-diacylglycerol---serine O-phosphatidyltransferase